MTTQITGNNISAGSITATQLTTTIVTTLNTAANISSVLVSNVAVSDSSWNVLDDTAVDPAGGYVVITGSGFATGAIVIVGTTNATSTSFVSSTTLQAQLPAQSAGTYPLYVVNADGSTAIRVNGVTYSAFPAWSTGSTLANQAADVSFGVNLSATSDSSITYSNTTPIPYGTTLSANGYFYGTVTIGTETTYSFDVRANDTQNQDTSRTFSLTVTVTPPYRLYSWGYNYAGLLGQNNTVYKSSPAQVGTGTTWLQITSAYNAMFGIKTDGTLWAAGGNYRGMLGINSSVSTSSPVQVGTLTDWSVLSKFGSSTYNMFAIKTDGTLWTWGAGFYGAQGKNDEVDRSSPVQIGADSNWAKVSSDNGTCFAIKTNGTLWVWGKSSLGSYGFYSPNSKSSPVQVGSDSNWSKISARAYGACAIKTNGTLWGWGTTQNGNAVGNNTSYPATDQITVTQIGADTDWYDVSAANFSAMAIKTNGTIWAWGNNANGQAGTDNTLVRSSPTQVGTSTDWLSISTGGAHTMAIKTNGTLWAWGYNGQGQLGINNLANLSSPVQVGGLTTWLKISPTSNSSFAIG